MPEVLDAVSEDETVVTECYILGEYVFYVYSLNRLLAFVCNLNLESGERSRFKPNIFNSQIIYHCICFWIQDFFVHR